MDQLIEPSLHCYRLGHSIQEWRRSTSSGAITFCAVCTLGYEKALTAFDGDTARADAFVNDLRSQRTL